MKLLAVILRVGLGGLFVLAGVLKLGDPTQFAIEINNYDLFPSLAPMLAVTLPFVEIVLGLALMGAPRTWRQAAALGLFGLLVMFTVAVGAAVARHINIECGCFGTKSGPVTWMTVGRDVVLLAVASAVLWLERGQSSASARRTAS